LAELHQAQGRYTDAEPLYRRALAISEKALGPDHPAVATSLDHLGLLYDHQGQYPDAEPLYKRALTIREKALGPDHASVSISLNNLAFLYNYQGRYAKAEPLLRRALAIFENALGPDHPGLGPPLNNLAAVYTAQGRYADAELLHRRALAIFEKAFAPDHPRVANTLRHLAMLYYQQVRYGDAEPLFKRSLAVREKVLGPDHPDVAQSLNNLADLYRAQGRDADALPLVETTIGQGHAEASVALPVLFAARSEGLMPAGKAQDDALDVVQRATQSVAAAALDKLATRLAAGSDRLAGLVRNDQDLAAEAEALEKAILAAVAKEPAERDADTEQRIRDRLVEIAKERTALQGVFAAEFPDYAVLSNPQPPAVKEIQGLLSDGEALLLFATGDKETYVFAVTR
jgi:tetratricopeptide (TPR) repeat protein